MTRFLPALRKKATPARSDERKVVLADYYSALSSAGIYSSYRSRPWPVERAVAEGYERIIWVFKSVEAISTNVSRLPFKLKQGEQEVEDHPLYTVLNGQANPLETGRQFRKRLCAQVLLSKRGAFVEITKSRGGDITRVDLLPPGRTRPVPGDGQELISHYEVIRANGTFEEIPPERVRWFREPHPLDPYSGVTPLEAAGLSVELDFFSRLYNVAFLRNDGRPGGVLAVDGEMTEDEMDRIEGRFGAGPAEAGKLTVINGEVSYIDLAVRPRDMAYETMSRSAKVEILTAFGVGESVIGFSADRTFDNAEQELYNFWTITMPPVIDMMSAGWDEDSTDNLVGYLDTSEVEVLQRAKIARREEARKEFEMGLISPDEYRERAGYGPIETPKTRALYLPVNKTVVATSEADQKKLDEEKAAAMPPALPPGRPPLPGQGDGTLPPGQTPPDRQKPPRLAQARDRPPPPRRQGEERPTLRSVKELESRPVLRLARSAESKAAGFQERESAPDEQAIARLETNLTAALTALMIRLAERTAARVASPKTRKGTRHWTPTYQEDTRVGVKALDAARAVEEARWREEATAAVAPLVSAAADVAATGLVVDLTGAAAATEAARRQAADVARAVTVMVGDVAERQALRMVALINTADQDGADVDDIVEQVRGKASELTGWASSVATHAATATIAGARDAAAAALAEDEPDLDVSRQWFAHSDAQVRKSHRAAHGQLQPLNEPFEVGEALLRWPGDPLGPPGETFNCRCRVSYRSRRSGRFVSQAS